MGRPLPPGIGDAGPTAWHRLDPLTKLWLAASTAVAAVLLGGIGCPPALGVLAVLTLGLLAVVVPASLAGVLRDVARTSVLLALPLAISVTLVNVLFTPGGQSVIAQVGPLRVTGEGVAVALEVVARVLVMAGAVVLFYVTTRPAALVASLQAHGLPPRLTFVIHNGVAMVPHLARRAAEVGAAQRARGLDAEGGLRARGRGILAVAAPTVLGAVAEVEARTLALETRAFSRPGPRALLWAPRDGRGQRLARWLIGGALALLALARLSGLVVSC